MATNQTPRQLVLLRRLAASARHALHSTYQLAHQLLPRLRRQSPHGDLAARPQRLLAPTAAGFDGAEGIRMGNPSMPAGGIFKLKRGSKAPSACPRSDFKQQLIWWMPEDRPAVLLWCNAEDQWFELHFQPITKP